MQKFRHKGRGFTPSEIFCIIKAGESAVFKQLGAVNSQVHFNISIVFSSKLIMFPGKSVINSETFKYF